jgi:hypothetical protein
MEHMVRRLPIVMFGCGLRYTRVSLALVPELLDGVRYFRDGELPPPQGLEARSPYAPKLGGSPMPRSQDDPDRRPRAPSMRTLVRWAIKCDNAEQLGERIRRRYDRQHGCRAGLTSAEEAEIERLLGKD